MLSVKLGSRLRGSEGALGLTWLRATGFLVAKFLSISMSKRPMQAPSNVEMQALAAVWALGSARVSEVKSKLADGKERAYTTVLTVMQSLERKRLVKRVSEGRAHRYFPAVPREQVLQDAVGRLVANAFGGNASDAVLAILATAKIPAAGKAAIVRALESTAAASSAADPPVHQRVSRPRGSPVQR